MLLVTIVGSVLIYEVFSRTVLAPLDKVDEVLEENMNEDEKKEMMQEFEQSRFYAFPFTIRLHQENAWHPMDSEVAEYRKIDIKSLRDNLGKEALQWAQKTIGRRALGELFTKWELRAQQSWLEVGFQERPPPYYVQSGIEVADDWIAWSTVPVDAHYAAQVERISYPVHAAKATWRWLTVLFSPDANLEGGRIMSEMLGVDPDQKIPLTEFFPPKITPEQQKMLREVAKKRMESLKQDRERAAERAFRITEEQDRTIEEKLLPSSDIEAAQSPNSGNTAGSPDINTDRQTGDESIVATQANTSTNNTVEDAIAKAKEDLTDMVIKSWTTSRGTQLTKEQEERLRWVLKSPLFEYGQKAYSRFRYASAVWRASFIGLNKPIVVPPPRGAIKVAGMMQMQIVKPQPGYCMFKVEMYYDPKTKTFDEDSFRAEAVQGRVQGKTWKGRKVLRELGPS